MRRLTGIALQIEEQYGTPNRFTQIGFQVEYRMLEKQLLTQIGLQIEYTDVVAPIGRVYGPALHCM